MTSAMLRDTFSIYGEIRHVFITSTKFLNLTIHLNIFIHHMTQDLRRSSSPGYWKVERFRIYILH